MRISENSQRDIDWYLSVSNLFTFDGQKQYFKRRTGENVIRYSPTGLSGEEAFHIWDSRGEIKATKDPLILWKLLKTKGSVNLHIKMYAEDKAKGIFPGCEVDEFCKNINAPEWFREAIINQSKQYYGR